MFKLPGQLGLQKSQTDKKFRIEGIMSAPIIDAENEVLSSNSYASIIEKVNARNASGDPIPVVVEHRRQESLPVGYIESAFEKDGKLGFKAVIASGGPGSLPDTVQQLITQNVLRHVSIGGDINQSNERAVESVYDSTARKYVRRINDAVIRELSLTGLPVNEEATFTLAKSLNVDAKGVKQLMARFNKAVSKELIGMKINKAINESDLGAIEDALKNLADVLKDQFNVDIDVDAIASQAKANPEMDNAGEVKPVTDETAPATPADAVKEAQPAATTEVIDETKETPVDVNAETELGEEDATEEVVEDEKAIESTEQGVEAKLDKLIELISKLSGAEEAEEVEEDTEEVADESAESEEEEAKEEKNMEKSTKNLDIEKKGNSEGGEQEMEKRLICKSCGEDFSYGSDDSIEKSFKFCPVCAKPLTKALIDNELNKVYFIESVEDAKNVNDETRKNAVIEPKGSPVTEANLSGKKGEIDSAGEEAAKNAVIHPQGYPVKESLVKSEEARYDEPKKDDTAKVEKNVVEMTIADKTQGNRLDDFTGEKVAYMTENKTDAKAVVDAGVKQDVFKRDVYPTMYNTDAGSVDQKIQKSLEPLRASLEAIQKSLTSSSPEGRRALFVNQKIEKSMPSSKDLDNQVFLGALMGRQK